MQTETHNGSTLYLVRARGDWAPTPTVGSTYPTRAKAIAAIANDPILTPDIFGEEPGTTITAVDRMTREVPGCTCYGHFDCAACVAATEDAEPFLRGFERGVVARADYDASQA